MGELDTLAAALTEVTAKAKRAGPPEPWVV